MQVHSSDRRSPVPAAPSGLGADVPIDKPGAALNSRVEVQTTVCPD